MELLIGSNGCIDTADPKPCLRNHALFARSAACYKVYYRCQRRTQKEYARRLRRWSTPTAYARGGTAGLAMDVDASPFAVVDLPFRRLAGRVEEHLIDLFDHLAVAVQLHRVQVEPALVQRGGASLELRRDDREPMAG